MYGETPTDNRQLCAKIFDGLHPIFYLSCVKTLYRKGIELYLPANGGRLLNVCAGLLNFNQVKNLWD